MSGGSHGYIYAEIEQQLCGEMQDLEMNDLVKDFVKVAHDLEWWDSSDICENNYRKTVAWFKSKWFGNRDARLTDYIDTACEKLRRELIQMVGEQK